MKQWIVCSCLAALVIPASQITFVGNAQAQAENQAMDEKTRRVDRFQRARERAQQRRAEAAGKSSEGETEEVSYPNATRAEPKQETKARTYSQVIKAHGFLNEGETVEAATAFAKLEANSALTNYERALVYQGLAQLAYEEDNIDQALAYWQKALDTDALGNHQHFQLLYQIAQIELMEERYENALAKLDEWMRLSGNVSADALALRGNALYRMERYPEAIQTLDRAIATSDSPQPSWLEMKMAAYYDQEDYANAARTLEELSELQPQEVKHAINLAQMYIELEQTDRALDVLQKLRQENRLTTPDHWRQLYQLLAYAEKPLDAAATIEAGLESGVLKADAQVLRSLGDNYYMAEQIPKAIDAYGRAAAVASDGIPDQQRGHLLVDQERYAEAKEALNAAFSKGGLTDEGTAWLLLGEAEFETGNRSAAKAAFEKAAGFESSRSNARIWLQNF